MGRKISILSTAYIDELNAEQDIPAGVLLHIIPFVNIVYKDNESLRQSVKDIVNSRMVIAFTSKHAVRAIARLIEEKPQNWLIYSLGKYTYGAVKECFGDCEVVYSGDNATEMAALILKNSSTNVVFFCGDKRLNTLPDTLTKGGVCVNELVVYKNIECATEIQHHYDGILFYSPSAVHSFFGSNTVDSTTVLFAIGDTTAAAVYNYTSENVVGGRVAGKIELLKRAIEYLT
jgi:uroporphyrinogen-III synthase